MTTFPKEEIDRVRQSHPLEHYLPTRGFELKRAGQELACLCPFHKDKNPSFFVNPEKQLWTCRAGCGGGDVISFVERFDSLGFADAVNKLGGQGTNGQNGHTNGHAYHAPKPKPPEAKPVLPPGVKPKIAATYSYQNAKGEELFQALRLEPKSFRQRRRAPEGGWIWNLEGVEPVLYRLPEVIESEFVWVVEGEKDADAISEFGATATCNPMGAGKWRESYTEALRDKCVIFCGDNDEPGERHMEAVERAVAPVAKWTRRVRVPDGCKDISEFLDKSTTREAGMLAMINIMNAAPELYSGVELPLQSMADLERDYREFIRTADRRAVNFSAWLPKLAALRPVVPGELVFILANTGAGKTAALQNIAASIPHLPTLFFELELPGTLTFERFAALATGTGARDVWSAYRGENSVPWKATNRLNHVHVCSKSGIKVSDIERFVNLAHLKTGTQPAVVMVDYIGLLHGEGKSRYERTSSVSEELKVLAKRTNTVVICASQVSRDKDDPNAEVSIFSGKDSGSIENSSGLLMGLWRDKNNQNLTYLRVLKSTKGGSGLMVHINFEGETMRMTQAQEQPAP